MRTARTLALLLLGGALLTACGDTEGDSAGPVGVTSTSPTPTDEVPTEPPSAGYPDDDYSFVVRRLCFCVDGGVPIEITVEDGEAVDARYLKDAWSNDAGDQVRQRYLWVTLDDVIELAHTKKADRIQLNWPEGQDYPRRVWVDYSFTTADEEMGYVVRRVVDSSDDRARPNDDPGPARPKTVDIITSALALS